MKQLNLYYINSGSSVPEGRTVLPTDDVSIWQRCGETGTTYTSLGQILADTATLIALMSSDNAVDYLVRSTTWTSAITTSIEAMKAIGASDYCSTTLLSDNTWNTAIQNSTYFEYVDNYKNPIMTSNTTPEGEAFLSKKYSDSFGAWKAFDYDTSTSAIVLAEPNNATGISYIGYVAPIPYVLKMAKILNYGAELVSGSHTIYVQGSDDGVTWGNLASDTFTQTADVWENILLTSNVTEHSQHRIYGEPLNYGSGNYHFSFKEIQFYGRTIGGVQTWLRSAGITNKTYTTLAEVLADSTTLSALMADHNAVDYLVTAKAWASTICADSTAMNYIGLNNYCANTLLADSTWLNAIWESAYKSSVLNKTNPTMTSDNTPSGYSLSGNYPEGNNHEFYKAFDNNNSTYYQTASSVGDNTPLTNPEVVFTFPSAFLLKFITIYVVAGTAGINYYTNTTLTVKGSSDGVNYSNVGTAELNISGNNYDAQTWNVELNSNVSQYSSYKFIWNKDNNLYQNRYHYLSLNEVKLYGREDV